MDSSACAHAHAHTHTHTHTHAHTHTHTDDQGSTNIHDEFSVKMFECETHRLCVIRALLKLKVDRSRQADEVMTGQ